MLTSILTSVIAYISTNLDDIFVLMILLAQAPVGARGRIAAGHFLGVGTLTAVSMLGALGLRELPLKYVGLLGLVPIALGVRAWVEGRKADGGDGPDGRGLSVLGMALITIGNGGDNVGVYLPLFAAFSNRERLAAALCFGAMTGVWVCLANTLAHFPRVRALVERYKSIAVPVVLVGLGVYIILDSGLLG